MCGPRARRRPPRAREPIPFAVADLAYGEAFRGLGEHGGLLLAIRLALIALLLLPATTLMGATLPLFCRQLARRPGETAATVGRLYAVNTLGGAVGCAATGLWLIPTVGVTRAIGIGALASLLAGALAWAAGEKAGSAGAAIESATPVARFPSTLIGALVFLIGFVALASEVLWTRYLALLIRNSVHTYTLALTVVLTGIVLGSALAGRLFDGRLGSVATFGWLQCMNGILVLVLVLLPPVAWKTVGTELPVLFALILPSAVLSGASLPLAIRLVANDPRTTGLHVGRMMALNILGGIAGALVTGFVGLPRLGLHVTALVITGTSVAAGAATWLLAAQSGGRWRPALTALGVALVWLAVPRILPTQIPADFLREDGVLLGVWEGLTSNVAVLRADGMRQLKMDRWWQGQSGRNHQIVAAHLPMLLRAGPALPARRRGLLHERLLCARGGHASPRRSREPVRAASPPRRAAAPERSESDARIADDLHYSHWDGADYWLTRPVVLGAAFLSGPRGLAALAGDAAPLRDDRPVLEYTTVAVREGDPPEPVIVPVLRRYLDPPETVLGPDTDAAVLREAATIREINLADLVAVARARQVEALMARGDHAASASLLSDILELQPRQATASRLLGEALFQLGRIDDARSAYRRALTLRPDDALAERGLGAADLIKGDTSSGVRHLRVALELRPEDAEAHNNLGVGLVRQGDVEGAVRHFEQAVALRPGDTEARRNLARARGLRE